MLNKLSDFIRKYNIESSLMIILIFGTFLRFYGLTVQSYWVDELFTLFSANPSATLMETLTKIFDDLVHPPVYNVLLWMWFKLFDFTEYAGRSFSAFTGALSILAIYYLGKETFNKNVGIYAALIVSLNYFLIYYSQEARSYSIFFLLTILSYLFLFKALRTQSTYNMFLYTFFTILVIYTHYFGFFLVASQFFVFLYYIGISSTTDRKKLIYMGIFPMIAIALSAAPLLYNILSSDTTIAAERMAWCKEETSYFFFKYVKEYFSYLVILFGMLLVPLAVKMYQKKIKNNHIVYALIIWVFISLLLPYIKSIISYPILTSRYAIYVLPALILIVSIAIDSIKNKKLKYIVLALIILFSVFRLYKYDYYTKPVKEEWRKITNYVIAYPENFPIYSWSADDKSMNAEQFSTYFQLLKSEKRALPIAQLSKELKSGQAPSQFWIINGHSKKLLPTALIDKYSLTKIEEVKGKETIGVLYDNSTFVDKSKN